MSEYSNITKMMGFKIPIDGADPATTPIFQNSAFESSSPYFYTRKDNPNSSEFEMTVKMLEEARHAIAVTTGMTAISLVLGELTQGQSLVINKDIYGCSYKLFQRVASKRKLKLSILDLSTEEGIQKIPGDCDMVIFETPTNPFLKTIDIKKVANHVKANKPSCLVVVDNTWATPLFQKPLKWGADISLYSATKYFSGHSDVMGGVIVTDNDTIAENLRQERFYTGAILAPFGAWLLRRSMQTLALRMNEHNRVTLELCEYLKSIKQIKRIYYPTVDGVQLTSYGGIIFFQFADHLEDPYLKFRDALELFGTGTGMACVTSMVAQPFSGSHASMDDHEKAAMGIDKNLVRLCFGLEEAADLKCDLAAAFSSLEKC